MQSTSRYFKALLSFYLVAGLLLVANPIVLPDIFVIKETIAQNPHDKELYFKEILQLSDAEQMREYINSINENYTNELIQYALDHFDELSIFANNQIFQVLPWSSPFLKQLVEKSLTKYGPVTENDLTIHIMIRVNSNTLADGVDAKPICLFEPLLGYQHTKKFSEDEIVQAVFRDPSKLSMEELNTVYYEIMTKPQDKKKLRDWTKKRYGRQHVDVAQELLADSAMPLTKPAFLYACSKGNKSGTATEKHFCRNIAHIVRLKKRYLQRFCQHNVKKMLWQAFLKEIDETKKGNYVFWHGRQWAWDFIADMYKQLYNLKANVEDRIGDTYVPLRFGDCEGEGFSMNYALFGNAAEESSGTVSYVLRNRDCSWDKHAQYSTQRLFEKFDLYTVYTLYATELHHLQQMHQDCNKDKYGSLLLLSFAEKDTHNVFPVQIGSMGSTMRGVDVNGVVTKDIKVIINALRTKPSLIQKGDSDRIEFGMLLTQDYALDPKKGLSIYSFHAADEKEYRKYCQERDKIFAKIARDLKNKTVK